MDYVYFFGGGEADGSEDLKDILGGKGANLAEMTNIGIPVPSGFTISAEVCQYYYRHDEEYPEDLENEVERNLKRLEEVNDKEFGDSDDPLLLSIRSGAAVSMPGMMDTVLNVGLNENTLEGLVERTGNPRFAWDSYRRLIQMYGEVVKGIEAREFDLALEKIKEEKGVENDTELTVDDLKEVVDKFNEIYTENLNEEFPTEPREQLWGAIDAVFGSWNNPRAKKYREINDLPDDALGTAVNVQTMVFGNTGKNSATGVAFTRNPSTGEKKRYGEYLKNAQGEDVVAGVRTPKDIKTLQDEMPEAWEELEEIFQKLEEHYKDVQDVEFTIENSDLYMLQTRTGKRTAKAAVKIAVDMAQEGLIDKETAIGRIDPETLDQLLHPSFSEEAEKEVLANGINASPGAAVGKVVFTAGEAVEKRDNGEKVILVRTETSPEDIDGLEAAEGVLTSRGGMTSHAAVVARGMGKPAVAGCGALEIDYEAKEFQVDGSTVKEGDYISIDGTTGDVMLGQVPTVEPKMGESFRTLMKWADGVRKLGVRTNADTPEDAGKARDYGAEGVGLCRTEHMFFGDERLPYIRQTIMAEDREDREQYLSELAKFQKEDFEGILEEMEGLPVMIRLLDPPLHEFLPDSKEEVEEFASKAGKPPQEVTDKLEELEEFNPMLGHRGCRLGITMPEIYEMQVGAIIRAAVNLREDGVDALPKIMVPLVGEPQEMKQVRNSIEKKADEVLSSLNSDLDYEIGTMIEIPRACLLADEIAEDADFFSFGTNDLTQLTFGYSRDDAGKFLDEYLKKEILEKNPFETLDDKGVAKLMETGTELGRSANPNLSVGICGEQGGDPDSIEVAREIGLDYVSASPFRVPIARLAAAQMELD
ncbi:pyruvate, phosphate dikinase [Candidatus Bipolaricaulota bacterium]|nr:pyruvate, phosphate dikinase [Candidatus Bipolaricaulota bacterium]MBS3813790.1 pyruvate, phosphate dikinase [Candidatus Bipolaricaulota bacterium]MBS3825222.1 pyruvate, phosphate dikinase [Candidatus Bipolaricaulota bacterium]